MEKRQKLSLITVICYLIFIAPVLIFGATLNEAVEGLIGAGVAGAVIGLLLLVLNVGAYVYAAVGVIPTVLKLIHIFVDKRIFAILSLPFDLIYISINLALLFEIISGGVFEEWLILAVAVISLLISLVAFITNILSIKD